MERSLKNFLKFRASPISVTQSLLCVNLNSPGHGNERSQKNIS